ncbi:hypothetical protein KA977_10265, partial [Candidatus Dependentiae bacterium]|nr:hypothetical protein [Candidatus Dependentiae bacterium]
DIQNKIIISADQKIKYENLITTIPLIEFLKLINNRNHFNNMISKLDYISVFNINYGIETSVNNQAHWIYFPEKKYDFYRAGFYHNFSEFSVPSKNHHSSYLEISYKGSSKKKQNKDFLKEIKKQFFEIGIYSENNSKICQQFLLDIKYAYVIFDRYRKEAIEYLTPIYKKNSIIPVGRYAEWDYSSMQDSIKSAHNAVSKL